MFSPTVRLILVIICLALAANFYFKEEYTYMVMMLVPAVLFIYGYFKYGTVYAATMELKKQNFAKAEKLINKVKYPERLGRSHKAYYHFSRGIIASEKEEWGKSISEFIMALDLGLRTQNDTAVVLLNLAHAEIERKNFTEAKHYLDRLKQINQSPMIKEEAESLSKRIEKTNS